MSVLSTTDLLTDITTNIYQNVVKFITGGGLQERLVNIAQSSVNRVTDIALLNLKDYQNSGRVYQVGEGTFYLGVLYRANTITSGAFDATKWDQIGTGPVTITKTPTDFAGGSTVVLAVSSIKIVVAIYNNISRVVPAIYDSQTSPSQMTVDMGDVPTSNVILKYV